MNPNAKEFMPSTKKAWSNPAKSVLVAQLPQQKLTRQTSKNDETSWPSLSSTNSSAPAVVTRVLPKPVKLQEEAEDDTRSGEWETVGGAKTKPEEQKTEKKELTEEEIEEKRQRRRERRQREKEFKRRRKEDEKRKALLAPQGSKIKVIDPGILRQVQTSSSVTLSVNKAEQTGAKPKQEKLRFQDQEYPSLGAVVATKKIVSKVDPTVTVDSGSDWETEDEGANDEAAGQEASIPENEQIPEVVQTNDEPMSYRSILKKSSTASTSKPQVQKQQILNELSDQLIKPATASSSSAQAKAKNVKRKDPISFDLFQAIQVKSKKPPVVQGSKIQKSSSVKAAPNKLDSTAPVKRRGKERVKPKKKKPTPMKKMILYERASKREIRQGNKLMQNILLPENAINESEGTPQDSQMESVMSPLIGEEPDTEVKEIQHVVQEAKNTKNLPSCVKPSESILLPELTPFQKAKRLLHSRKFRE